MSLTTRPEWHDRAACRGTGPERFYISIPGDTGAYSARLEAATAYCQTCPVTTDCANAAARNHERFGVWAGRDRTKRAGTRTKRTAA